MSHKRRQPSKPGRKAKADPVFEQGVRAARAMREDEAAWLRERLLALGAAVSSAKARQGEIEALTGAMRQRQSAREGRWLAAQDRLAKAYAFDREPEKHAARLQRLARMASLAEQGRIELAHLEAEQASLPARIATLEAAIADIQAALHPDAINAKAASAGARAMAKAREDREDGAVTQARAEAQKAERSRDRDGPTAMQIAMRGVEKVGANGAVRLGADLPDTMRRLLRAGIINADEAQAAAHWRADWHAGSRRNALTGSYAERVDGGRTLSAPGEGAVAAWNRFVSAEKALPAGSRMLAQSVILYEAVLETAPGLGERYANKAAKRAANAAVLAMACEALKTFYDSHLGERA